MSTIHEPARDIPIPTSASAAAPATRVFAVVRVQVTCNQMGEAAGEGAALAVRGSQDIATVDPAALRRQLADLGAIII